jgi:glutamate-1-semialdehyde 2,1-aminomutase
MGGGLPAGAFAGRADLMRLVSPDGPVYQAGTLSGNPLAVAAGLATFNVLDEDAYRRLDAATAQLAAGLQAAARDHGVPAWVPRTTGLLTLFFSEGPVRDLADAQAADADAYARFCRGMLDRGVYLPPSPFEAWFPSLAHSDEHIDLTISAAAGVFATW